MPSTGIPMKDADFLAWGNNFAARITAAPATYGLVAGDAVIIQNAADDYATAYANNANPDTRTTVTVAAKDGAKAFAATIYRSYYNRIKYNPAVLDADKVLAGVHLNDTSPTPIPPPSTYPVLTVLQAGPLSMSLKYGDVTTPDAKRKPEGVTLLLMFRAIGVAPASDPETAKFDGAFTKTPLTQEFDAADRGKYVTYFAKWANGKGQEGPWSAPVSFVIA